jgi:hypothetical protein
VPFLRGLEIHPATMTMAPAGGSRNDTERLEKLFDMYAKMAGNRTVS